jgi:hypothetical protein
MPADDVPRRAREVELAEVRTLDKVRIGDIAGIDGDMT